MNRIIAGLCGLGLAACSSKSPAPAPPSERITNLDVEPIQRGSGDYAVAVAFDYRPGDPPPETLSATLLTAQVACQAGALRFAESIPALPKSGTWTKAADRVVAIGFTTLALPKQPTLCDVAVLEQPKPGGPVREIARQCATVGGASAAGPCPANPVDGPGQGAGFSIAPPTVASEGALQIAYVVTAHHDVGDERVAIDVACKSGLTAGETYDSRRVRTGESTRAKVRVFVDAAPAADDACTLGFAAERMADAARTPITQYCWRGGAVSAGPCP